MNRRILAVAGLVIVLLGLVATVCIFAFAPGLRHVDWLDLEMAALGSAIICLVGCALGWASVKTPVGRTAAIIGSLLILFYGYQLLRTGDPGDVQEPTVVAPAMPQRLPLTSRPIR